MEYATLLFEAQNGVAHITLNRPEAANTINEQMGKDLLEAVLHCDEDPGIRAVMISGSGKMFSGGGDLRDFSAKGKQLPFYFKKVTTYFHAAMSRLTRMDAPVVAAVQGATAGAGMSIAIACDIVIAAESTRFMVAYTRAGLTPDGARDLFPTSHRRPQARFGVDAHESDIVGSGGIGVGHCHPRGARRGVTFAGRRSRGSACGRAHKSLWSIKTVAP